MEIAGIAEYRTDEALAEALLGEWLLELWAKTDAQSESIALDGRSFLTDGAGRILRWGKEAAEAHGYLEEELRGLTIDVLVGPVTGARLFDRMRAVMLGAQAPQDWRESVSLMARHGAEEPVELSFSALGEGPGIVWSVSIRRQARKPVLAPVDLTFALREALQAAVPHLPDDVLVFLEDCPRGLSALGYRVELRRAIALLTLNAAERAGANERITFQFARPGGENDPLPDRGMAGDWIRLSVRHAARSADSASEPSRLVFERGLPMAAEAGRAPSERLAEAFALVKSMGGVLDLKWEDGGRLRSSVYLPAAQPGGAPSSGVELDPALEAAR